MRRRKTRKLAYVAERHALIQCSLRLFKCRAVERLRNAGVQESPQTRCGRYLALALAGNSGSPINLLYSASSVGEHIISLTSKVAGLE